MFFNKMATRRKLIWYSYLSATVPVTVGRLFQKHLYCKSYCTSCYVYIVWWETNIHVNSLCVWVRVGWVVCWQAIAKAPCLRAIGLWRGCTPTRSFLLPKYAMTLNSWTRRVVTNFFYGKDSHSNFHHMWWTSQRDFIRNDALHYPQTILTLIYSTS